ncbi:MAG TPA: SAM-dependent methyltransferase, partial [Gammaproteobacteria bacterium]|nr:SAM-dependent methyltransferase [Gammaproteobacteria bacterium]
IGVILANEVLDAMPVHVFHYRDHHLFEVFVAENNGQLINEEYPATAALIGAVAQLPIEDAAKIDYLSEINLQLPGWMQSLSASLRAGYMIFIDYGFDAHTYYHPHRSTGTLMCHYQHRAHNDVFFYPGLQDITAHVDFTAVAQAGLACGLEVEYFANQARFLLENGLLERASTPSFTQAQQINTLTAPHEMGELFKVMVLKKSL